MEFRLLNVSEIRFKISLAMSPSQRPRGVLGFWSSLMTALGNTENMTVSLRKIVLFYGESYSWIFFPDLNFQIITTRLR